MKTENLLDFLNVTNTLYTLDYSTYNSKLVNFLDLLIADEQLTQKIDLGILFLSQKTLYNYIIIDGLSRLLSLSLLLHAICECYKKKSPQNDKAIKTIRSKYLFNNDKTKLRLNNEEQVIYEKILNGEPLSGKEKKSPLFVLLHKFWVQIKEEAIPASKIFKMLQKIYIRTIDIEEESYIDLYVTLNKDKRDLDQLKLIQSYLKEHNLFNEWNEIVLIFKKSKIDLIKFLRDYFITKFNYRKFDETRLYELFVNYYETILKYISKEDFIKKLKRSASLYFKMINVKFDDDNIKEAFIKIKMHNGEDTFAYILNIYEDYLDNNISYVTLLEILSTIDEYLKNRLKNPNNVGFNELIEYLNAFITCK